MPPEEPVAEVPETPAPQAEVVPTIATPTEQETCDSDEAAKSAQSWEERLKRALALDASEEAEPTSMETPASTEEEVAQPVVSPSFEFQLDPPPKIAEPEPAQPAPAKLELELPEFLPKAQNAAPTVEQAVEPSKTSVKTLADFAASAVKSAADTTASVSSKAISTLAEATRDEEQSGRFGNTQAYSDCQPSRSTTRIPEGCSFRRRSHRGKFARALRTTVAAGRER